MNTKKVIAVLLWIVLAYALVATIVTIYQDNKPQTAQLKPQKFTEKDFTPPAKNPSDPLGVDQSVAPAGYKFVSNAAQTGWILVPTDNQFSDLPNANGTPAGAWAATLVRMDAIAPDLYYDPAAKKSYRLTDGKLFREPLDDLLAETISRPNFAAGSFDWRAWQQQVQNQEALDELRRANDIAERKSLIIQNPSPTPISIYGNSSRIGGTTFRNYYSSDGQSIYGNSTQIGGTVFHNYYSSDGQSLYGNTIFIGNTAFTTLYGN